MTYQEGGSGRIASVVTSHLRFARKVAVAVIGASVLAFGIALIVLPGPAFIVIPLGPRDSGDRVPLGPQTSTPRETRCVSGLSAGARRLSTTG